MSVNKQIIDEIIKDMNEFFVSNDNYNKKDFSSTLAIAGKSAYDKFKTKGKAAKKENKEPKELSQYQLFMKEKMVELKAREDARVLSEGETKKQPKELMKEIGELWKEQKEHQ